jgi:hypothetical protein
VSRFELLWLSSFFFLVFFFFLLLSTISRTTELGANQGILRTNEGRAISPIPPLLPAFGKAGRWAVMAAA